MSSDKLPQGRHLSGVSVVYDVDVRRPGEFHPQLGVRSTITNYDPRPVLGRQIAVNKSYICCGLKQGNIRVLNNHTGLECLLRAHTQRVTDMAFFAEDVHLLASVSVEGRLFVWKISEGLDEGGTPQIKGKIVIAIQIVDEGEAVHPRVCWHCSKQEVLFVGVGKRALRIDTTKVAKCGVPSAEDPIKCPVEKLIDGVQFVGEHDGEVTDLSMCQGMTTTRLVSASMDGTIKIWEDRKSQPLTVLRPYDGLPVYSSIFMTAPNKPDHIILVTVGPLNREVKIWSSATEVLTSDDESWKCTQTLELKSSAQPRVEDAFFNQVIALSQAGLLLLANAKKNAIYAMHIDFGGEPAATHMDYIAEFTVTMPILSFTGTSISPHGEQIVQVYCVQTQAIQQYALDLSKCLPPPLENTDTVDSNTELELQRQIDAMQDEMNRLEIMQTKLQTELQEWKKARKDNTDALQARVREEISKIEKLWRERIQQGTVERTDFPVLLDKMVKKEIAALGSAIETKIILAISDCFQKLEKSVNSNLEDTVRGVLQKLEESVNSNLEATVRSQIQLNFQTLGNQARQGDGAIMSEPLAQPHYVEEDQEHSGKDVSGSATATTTSQLQTPNAKSRKQEWKNMQASCPSSPSLGVLNSVESFNEAGGSLSPPSRQAAVPQRMAMHNLVKQLCDEDREYLQKLRARVATVLDRIKKEEAEKKKKIAKDEVSGVLNPRIMFKHPTHPITPSEILMDASPSESTSTWAANGTGWW